MAEVHLLPEVIIEEEVEFDLPDMTTTNHSTKNPTTNSSTDEFKFPVSIHMKKQKLLVPWFQPEQTFVTSSMNIDPSNMQLLDDYLNKNLPNDPLYKSQAIKFVENVLLGRTTETHKSFGTDTLTPKSPGFVICFSF